MDNQEMQFADPAWQPPHLRDNTMPARQPVSTKPGEQPEQQSPPTPLQSPPTPLQTPAPDRDTGAYATGYTGYRQQQSAQIRPARRRRRSPFLSWIIIAFILLALLGGGYQMYAGSQVPAGYLINTGPPPYPPIATAPDSSGDVQTNVGTSPDATVVLKTATGSINLIKH
jgi:hypothetical protein